MPLHLYGILRSGTRPPQLDGVGSPGGTLELVEQDGLAALVSELDEQDALTEDDAVTHLDVLAAVASNDTVLPLRFATTAADADAVRAEVLQAGAPEWQQRLTALAGCVELRIDFDFDEQRVLREVVDRQPGLRDLGGGTGLNARVQTGEAVAHAVRELVRARVAPLLHAPARYAERTVELAATEPAQSRWALLVRRERVTELDGAVHAMETPAGVQVRYTGPLPAYDFVDELPAEQAGQSRWGW